MTPKQKNREGKIPKSQIPISRKEKVPPLKTQFEIIQEKK
jgi:hypothetical protein